MIILGDPPDQILGILFERVWSPNPEGSEIRGQLGFEICFVKRKLCVENRGRTFSRVIVRTRQRWFVILLAFFVVSFPCVLLRVPSQTFRIRGRRNQLRGCERSGLDRKSTRLNSSHLGI